jgi:hypothetical protein
MRIKRNTSRIKAPLAMLFLLAIPGAHAAGNTLVTPAPLPSIAFARYIASLRSGDPFQEPGYTLLTIQASLPELYKEAAVVAVRKRDANGACMYAPLEMAGDGSVLTEVIDRYFDLERELSASPEKERLSPANYKFHYDGEVKMGLTPALVFRVTPKKRTPSSFTGKIWIDPATGSPVLYAGEVGRRKITVVRDVKMLNGVAVARLDHVSFALPQLGRAEVVVTELPVSDALPFPAPQEKSLPERQVWPGVLPRADFQ